MGVNRIGKDPNVDYCGSSAVFGPAGEDIISPFAGEQIIQVKLSANSVEAARSSFPALKDRRDIIP